VPTGKGLVLPWDPKKVPQDTRDYVIMQFITDDGVVGTTMDGDYKLPAGIGKTVQEVAEAYFVGKDPFDIETHNVEFFQKAKAGVRLFFLEIGLWDIIGKICNQPLYKLWGAHASKVKPYAATVHFDKTPQQRAEDALRFYELGFRAIKIRLHHDKPAEDLAMAAVVKNAVGDKMDVMVDANQAGKKAGDPSKAVGGGKLAKLGHKVRDLTRTRMGPLTLEGIPVGHFRPLTGKEAKELRRSAEGHKGKGEGRGTKDEG